MTTTACTAWPSRPFLRQQGHLRPDVTEAEARDVMWAYTDPRLYELLVLRQPWPLERFRDFLARALTAALLPGRPLPLSDGARPTRD